MHKGAEMPTDKRTQPSQSYAQSEQTGSTFGDALAQAGAALEAAKQRYLSKVEELSKGRAIVAEMEKAAAIAKLEVEKARRDVEAMILTSVKDL
jgi:hypothetical protein